MEGKRRDLLRGLQVVIVAALVLVAAGFAVNLSRAVQGERPVATPVMVWRVTADAPGADGVGPRDQAIRMITFEYSDAPYTSPVGWYLITTLPTVLVLAGVLLLLLRVVRRARRGDPFTIATVRDLRWIAGITLLGGFLASFADIIALMALEQRLTGEEIAGFTTSAVWIFGAFAAFVFAEIVKRGCVLRDELAEVI